MTRCKVHRRRLFELRVAKSCNKYDRPCMYVIIIMKFSILPHCFEDWKCVKLKWDVCCSGAGLRPRHTRQCLLQLATNFWHRATVISELVFVEKFYSTDISLTNLLTRHELKEIACMREYQAWRTRIKNISGVKRVLAVFL